MKRRVIQLVSIIVGGGAILLAYNTFLHNYSLSFLTICGTGWWGIARFLLWILGLAGLCAIVYLLNRGSGTRCKCGCRVESGWCNCPNCGDVLQ